MMMLYYRLRCRLGRPVCYRKLMNGGDWWFSICMACDRQAEAHDGRLLSRD
jgi:hypothetical protein